MSDPRSLFIAGTDTGVGKTRVAARLIRNYVAQGARVSGMKPVAAGAEPGPDGLRNDDALALQAAGNIAIPYALLNPYCLSLATSPHLAARAADVSIEPGRVFEAYARITGFADVVVVEGAGGWLAPISPSQSMADIAIALGLPVVLVVGMRLGCLSHALLTAAAIQTTGLSLAGWYANQIDPAFEPMADYLDSLQQRLPAPRLGFMAYGDA
ncbi:MAG: dethiobiotin synthase [Steroidobacteraceae bacterium]